MMPLTMKGLPAILAISASCSTVLLPAGGFMPFRKGRPAPSTSMATAKQWEACTSSILALTVSWFQGFTVGTPMPWQAAMALQADFITSAFRPSPVKAAMPFSAQALTSTLL